MRRTLRICRNAWTRFGNCPGSPLPVLPLSDSGQRCRPASFFPFPARLRLPFLRLSKGRKPCLSLLRRDNSVREPNVQPAPATGLFKGFGTLSQQAETAVSGDAGNRSFESLWEQRHCLPSLPSLYRIRYKNGYTEKNIIPSQQKEGRWHKGFGSKNSV